MNSFRFPKVASAAMTEAEHKETASSASKDKGRDGVAGVAPPGGNGAPTVQAAPSESDAEE